MMTVTPAYGRDYKTAAAARADWYDGKDFVVADFFSPWHGKPTSLNDHQPGSVTIRFDAMRKTTRV